MNKKVMVFLGGLVTLLVLAVSLFFINQNNKNNKRYLVTFNTNGGTLVESVELKRGETLVRPADPTKQGYIFVEWELNGEAFDFTTPITEDITLTASFKKIDSDVKTYVVKFDSNGGTTTSNQIVEEGKRAKKPTDPTKEGYEFKGWFIEEKEYNFNLVVSKDMTLTAKWEKKKETTKPVNNNTTTNNNSNSTKPNNNTGNNSNTNTTPVVVQNYTVSFNSNGGSAVASQTVSGGKRATQPSNPTREGYTFAGWKLNGSAYNFASAVNSNINLVASWTPKTYTVKVTLVDAYSPDRILTVYENGTPITVSSIKYTDGYTLCSGSNTTVNKNDIEGETSLLVVLSGGTQVTASVS